MDSDRSGYIEAQEGNRFDSGFSILYFVYLFIEVMAHKKV